MKVSVTFIVLLMLTTTFSHGFILRAIAGGEDRQDYQIRRRHTCFETGCRVGLICNTDGFCVPTTMSIESQ
nr:conotoxin precursor Cerm03 [Conus judaeus]DAZ86557.1 TPA_inf: conotoxin precursor Cerm03 [Conus judaeus]DAZ86906.1 TPA_inf: conotoxin precursor Cerm03 [Conus judaeus]